MKKILIFAFFVFLAAGILVLPVCAETAGERDATSTGDFIGTSRLYCYSQYSEFSGHEVRADFDLEDYCVIEVDGYGGIHTFENQRVYSNCVTISLNFQFDSSHTIAGGARVESIKRDTVDGEWVEKTRLDLKTDIGYGTVVVSREKSGGDREIYPFIHFNGDSRDCEKLTFTEDGVYHLAIFFAAKFENVLKYYVAEYVFSVRSAIYVTDVNGEYHIKATGFFYDDACLNFAGRSNIDVYVNGRYASDGYVLKAPQSGSVTYDISVFCDRVESERFSVTLYKSNSEHFMIYGTNLRRKLGDAVYEAEHEFKLTWNPTITDGIAYVSVDGSEETVYERESVIKEPGTYTFRMHSEAFRLDVYYVVLLCEDEAPSHNYQILSSNRFNNFITKWYEVYDPETELYYCFHLGEYSLAYEAAMTVERQRVVTKTTSYLYDGEQYESLDALTAAMHTRVSEILIPTYYDAEDSTLEKYFSNRLFDGTVYLNPDFQFVQNHPSESATVIITDVNGNSKTIDYFTPISEYGLAEGIYTITETDLYGNIKEYKAIVDRSAPTLHLSLGEERVAVHAGSTYTAPYFRLTSLSDLMDGMAVACVNDEVYYLSNELEGNVFYQPGNYFIKAYDRNGHIVKCIVSIPPKECFCTVTEGDEKTELVLNSGVRAERVQCIPQTEYRTDTDGKLLFFRGAEDIAVTVYVINEAGSRDCISFTVASLSAENPAVQVIPTFDYRWGWIIGIVLVSALTGMTLILQHHRRKGKRKST